MKLRVGDLVTITHDNKLPAVIEETGQTEVRVRLTDPQICPSMAGPGLSVTVNPSGVSPSEGLERRVK